MFDCCRWRWIHRVDECLDDCLEVSGFCKTETSASPRNRLKKHLEYDTTAIIYYLKWIRDAEG